MSLGMSLGLGLASSALLSYLLRVVAHRRKCTTLGPAWNAFDARRTAIRIGVTGCEHAHRQRRERLL
jgi:hypothetical protein